MALALAEAGADIILVQVRKKCALLLVGNAHLLMPGLLQRDEVKTTTRDAVQKLGRKATVVTADLADPCSVSTVIPNLVKSGRNMDILVTAAGIQSRHPAHQFPDEDWNKVLQVNLSTIFTLNRDFGAYLLSKPAPASGKRGSIINIASLLTFQGGITVPAYAAAKGGVAQLTKALSNEWSSKGICVNAIAPGYIDTDMNTALINDEERQKSILSRIPIGRWGKPEDFCGPVVFLASEASSYVCGEILTVDGGWMGR